MKAILSLEDGRTFNCRSFTGPGEAWGEVVFNTSMTGYQEVLTSAFLVKEYQDFPSNFRSTSTLADYLKAQGILGIEQFDTRALTRHIRKTGAMRAFITTRDSDPASCVKRARGISSMAGQDLVKEVTTKVPYFWTQEKPVYIGKDVPLSKNIWKYSLFISEKMSL